MAVFLSAQKHLITTCEGQVDRRGQHVICHTLAKSNGWKEGFHTLGQIGVDSATHALALKTEEVDNLGKKMWKQTSALVMLHVLCKCESSFCELGWDSTKSSLNLLKKGASFLSHFYPLSSITLTQREHNMNIMFFLHPTLRVFPKSLTQFKRA